MAACAWRGASRARQSTERQAWKSGNHGSRGALQGHAVVAAVGPLTHPPGETMARCSSGPAVPQRCTSVSVLARGPVTARNVRHRSDGDGGGNPAPGRGPGAGWAGDRTPPTPRVREPRGGARVLRDGCDDPQSHRKRYRRGSCAPAAWHVFPSSSVGRFVHCVARAPYAGPSAAAPCHRLGLSSTCRARWFQRRSANPSPRGLSADLDWVSRRRGA